MKTNFKKNMHMCHAFGGICFTTICLHSLGNILCTRDALHCIILNGFVINCIVSYGDAWCCMVQHGIAWYCLVLHGIAWYCIVLHGTALYSMVLQGNAWYCMILYGIDLYYIVSNFVYVSAQCLMVLHVIALFCIVLCGVAR